MSSSPLIVRKVAILGAGVMGAQIAAHFTNAGIPVLLYDLPAKEGDPNGLVVKAIAGLAKLEPAPLAAKDRVSAIEPCNYGADLARLAECDLVIEAIAERLDWKKDLYEKIAPHLAPGAIVATNTSGLSLRRCPPRCRPPCDPGSAACISSIRRGTCIWSKSSMRPTPRPRCSTGWRRC